MPVRSWSCDFLLGRKQWEHMLSIGKQAPKKEREGKEECGGDMGTTIFEQFKKERKKERKMNS